MPLFVARMAPMIVRMPTAPIPSLDTFISSVQQCHVSVIYGGSARLHFQKQHSHAHRLHYHRQRNHILIKRATYGCMAAAKYGGITSISGRKTLTHHTHLLLSFSPPPLSRSPPLLLSSSPSLLKSLNPPLLLSSTPPLLLSSSSSRLGAARRSGWCILGRGDARTGRWPKRMASGRRRRRRRRRRVTSSADPVLFCLDRESSVLTSSQHAKKYSIKHKK
eukprot:2898224-Rhodomonas_salina.1